MGTSSVLKVTDSRTGRSYDLPITDGTIRAIDLRRVKASENDFGLMSYDPAFLNTASCRSAITFSDGFHHDAHQMGILVSTVAALSTFYPEAKVVSDETRQDEQVVRLIAKMPTLAAFAYRHAMGLPYAYPDDELSYAGNFLSMMWKMTEPKYSPDPVLEHALDVLFTLHADHEQNCSTSAMRVVGSSQADPFSAAAAAAAALYGPVHGVRTSRCCACCERAGLRTTSLRT